MIEHTKISKRQLTKQELEYYSLDSLRVKIPLDFVTIDERTSKGLGQEIIHSVKNTDEVIEVKKQNMVKISRVGYDYNFIIESMPTGKKDISIKFLTILINAKMLEKDYFYGITINNISLIYTKLMDLGVVYFTYKDFLDSSMTTDTDVKFDSLQKLHVVREGIEDLASKSKISPKQHVGREKYGRKTNIGIDFNTRTRATASSPYFKIYHKEIELKNKSFNFKNAYLEDIEIKDLVRFEYTLKDKAMRTSYGLKANTLREILEVSQDKLKMVHREFLLRTFTDYNKATRKQRTNISPMDTIFLHYIRKDLKSGMTIEQIKYDLGLQLLNDKKIRRMSEKVDELYASEIKGKEVYKESEEMSDFFNFVGGGNKGFFLENMDDEDS